MKSVSSFEGNVERPGGGADFLVVMRTISIKIREFQVIVLSLCLAPWIEFDVKGSRAGTAERLGEEGGGDKGGESDC